MFFCFQLIVQRPWFLWCMNTAEISRVVSEWLKQTISNTTNNTFSFLCLCLSEVAPYLRGGGQGQQVVLEGNRLVLTCLAGGSWPLQYRWTLNNSNITDWTPQYRSVSTHCLVIMSDFLSWIFSLSLSVYVSLVPFLSYTNICRVRAVPVRDGVCVEVRAFGQQSQSEINNYISTINMYMVWVKRRGSNQYVCAVSLLFALYLFFSSSSSCAPSLSVPVCVGW